MCSKKRGGDENGNDVLRQPEPGHHDQHLQEIASARARDEIAERRLFPFALDLDFPDLGFRHHKNVVEHENAGEQRPDYKGNAPAPLRVSRVFSRQGEDGEHQHRDERDGNIGGGKGGEDEAAGEAALVFLGIFDRQRMSSGIPPAKANAVEKAQDHQQPI
jgi:hypothetical protein